MKYILSLALLSVLSWPACAVAQSLSLGASQQDVLVLLNPETPTPFQEVHATLSSNAVDLNRSVIRWALNGKVEVEGDAKKEFVFTVGKLGSVSKLSIAVDTPNLGTLQKNLTIAPTQLDIVWQADTYTPPFYRGRALAVPESRVTAVALPSFMSSSGKTVAPEKLIYKWTVNDRLVGDQSGLGKDTFRVTEATYTENTPLVTVEVSDPTTGLRAVRTVSAPAVQPTILMYNKDPLLGTLFNYALGSTFSPNGQEFTVVAYPYFFSADRVTSSFLNYQWSINNTPTNSTGRQPNELTLRIPDNSSGISLISLFMTRAGALFQKASGAVGINLGETDR